jgi:ketosteroid isomerase-like protein
MAAEDNVKTIQSLYDAFGRGDVDTILASVADDIDWAAEAASDAAPWYGPRRDKDAVAKFFADIGGTLEVLEFTVQSIVASGDEVMALIRFRFTPTGGGDEGDMNVHHYWRLRDGKVEKYRGTEDTAQMAAVLGA